MDLKQQLDALNISLFILSEAPQRCIPELIKSLQCTEMHLQREWTREETTELLAVCKKLDKAILVSEHDDGFLFHPEDLPFKSIVDIPEIFTVFRKRCERELKVRNPLPAPSPKAPWNRVDVPESSQNLQGLSQEPLVPDSRTAFPFSGGSAGAWDRINTYFWEKKQLSFYKRTRNGLIGSAYSSKLSPWLANGGISAREIYREIKNYELEIQKNEDTYWLFFELMWRDFFRFISKKHGNRIFYSGGILKNIPSFQSEHKHLKAWIEGQTANDFINANMIELSKTGWMSNRGRQNVASYLVRHLKQDWRIGAAWFEHMLIDYDVHSNWCNWMYNSGVGNDPRDRTFNPDIQASRYDADGKFRKRWLQNSLFDSE
ncbi:MAG: hypothetical protein RLZZ241_1621 [Bacteroidota bacterium]